MLSAVKPKYRVRQDSEKSEKEKMQLCGQTPMVDTKNIVKVKKTADFI